MSRHAVSTLSISTGIPRELTAEAYEGLNWQYVAGATATATAPEKARECLRRQLLDI